MTTDYNLINNTFKNVPQRGSSNIIWGSQNKNLPAAAGSASSAGFDPTRLQQYRPLFEKYFRPEDVNKAIWTSFWEGGVNKVSDFGDNPPQGRATGLLQILPKFESNGKVFNPDLPTQQELLDPETNIRTAAYLVYNKGGWSHWQDNPKPGEKIWGALGAHPYIEDVIARNPRAPTSPLPSDYQQQLDNAKSTAEASMSAIKVTSDNVAFYQQQAAVKKQQEIQALTTKPQAGQDLYHFNQEYQAKVKEINDKYDAEYAAVKLQSSVAADNFTKANTWYSVISDLPNIVADATTNIKNVDDLEKFINSVGKDAPWFMKPATGGGTFKFSQDQREYLDKAISHLAPFLNRPEQQPIDQQHLTEFLAAASSATNIPSHRVSLASLSVDGIKKLLTTAPSGTKQQLPPGLTAEKLRAYYDSYNLLDDESKKAIEGIQGKAKDLVRRWINEDARIQAYKLNLADPTNAVPDFKSRESSILQWGLDKLEVYSHEVVRPLAAYGLTGLGELRDRIPFGLGSSAISPAGVLFNAVYSDEDTDQLRKLVRQNRHEGMGWREAGARGFEQWDGNLIQKMLAETIADPTTYLGFGVYTKLFKPIPILGKAVGMTELGWKAAWDNPVLTHAAHAATGATIGYSITGDEKGILAGAAFPLLRHVPVYTANQLTERISRSLLHTTEEALLTHNHVASIAAISPEQYHDTITAGLEFLKTNPQTGHLTPQARMVKGIINVLDPWIPAEDIAGWLIRGSEGERIAERGSVQTGTRKVFKGNTPEDVGRQISTIRGKKLLPGETIDVQYSLNPDDTYTKVSGVVNEDGTVTVTVEHIQQREVNDEAVYEVIKSQDYTGTAEDVGAQIHNDFGRDVPVTVEVPAANRISVENITRDQELAVNRTYDLVLSHETKGVINLDQAADHILNILGLSGEEAFKSIKLALTERIEAQTNRILEAATGNDVAEIHKNLGDKVRASALSNYQHPLTKQAEFQGYVMGLGRKVEPITKLTGYQWLANAQNWYAHSMLWFFNFKPFNFLETEFRSALGGGGWHIPIQSDEVATVLEHHGWNAATPYDLRKADPSSQLELTRVTKGRSTIPELKKKSGLLTSLGNIVKGNVPYIDKVERNIKALAFDQKVFHRWAEINPEAYREVTEFRESVRAAFMAAGVDQREIAGRMNDLMSAYLRPDAPEFIRTLKTDVTQASKQKLVTDVYTKAQQYQHIDQLITDKVIRDLQAGRVANLDDTFAENLDMLLDMPAVKAERGEQALREMRQQISNILTEDPSIENMQRALKFIVDSRESINMATHEIVSTATTRGHAIHGANKAEHWNLSDEALYNYVDTATSEFAQMADDLRNHVKQFFPDQEAEYNTLVNNMVERNRLMTEWRRSDAQFFTDFRRENGRQPHAEEYSAINKLREQNYDKYQARELELLRQQQSMARTITPSDGVITDVTNTTGLTLPHVAQLLTSSGDELAQSLVIGNSLQRREVWVSSVLGEADAAARKLGKTADQLGWTKEAVTKVYDNLRVRAGTDPAESTVLYQARQELESLRKDAHLAAMNSGYKPETIDVINEQYERFAQLAEQTHNIRIQVPDLTPELINPEQIGNGLISRFKWQKGKNSVWFTTVNNTDVELSRLSVQPSGGRTYEVSIKRNTAYGKNQTMLEAYTSRAEGSDLQALVNAGKIIDDVQRNNPDAIIFARPSDSRRMRIYERAGFRKPNEAEIKISPVFEESDTLVLDKLNLNTPAPVARPGTGTRELVAPNTEFHDSVNQAYEKAHVDYQHIFTDYDNGNIFDAFMRGIFPFWYYQASRWPYLTTEALRHPGLITGFGRYQDYTEKGYTHIPGVDLAFNVVRGTILMGGMSGLIHQFPARYEDGIFGDLAHGLDSLGKSGFYPGLWTTLPLALAGINDFQLSPPIEFAFNATQRLGWDFPASVRDRIFPSKFREYYTQELASKYSQERGLEVSGSDIRRKLDLNTATDEEKSVWQEAQRNLAGYQLLFDQTGILKLDIEEKRAANRELAQYLETNLGISKEKQDAITDRLGDSGYRLLDFFPLDPAASKKLYETTRYKYWAGNSTSLNPKEFVQLQDKINNFWDEVTKIDKQAKENGFTDRNGKHVASLDELDTQFKSGEIGARDYLKAVQGVKTQRSIAIQTLQDNPYYKGVPVTLEQREQYRTDHNMPMPVDHPAKELLNQYHSIPLEDDKNGEPMWDKYFASLDGLLYALPDDKRAYLLDYIQKDWTDSQKLYWQTNNQFIRPYMNLREGVLQAISPQQQDFLRRYEGATPAQIKNLDEVDAKLVTDYNAALSRAREKYRQLDPTTDAWLFYWGKTSSLQSELARQKYNEIVKKNGGGVPLTNPIKETTPTGKPKNILPALP